MKFLVITTRKDGVKVDLPPSELYQAFKSNVDYFVSFQKKGKVISMGGVAGQHSSYKLFDVENREELETLINNAPLRSITNDQIYQIVDFDDVLGQLRSRLGLTAQKV